MKKIIYVLLVVQGIIFAEQSIQREKIEEWIKSYAGFEKNYGQFTDFYKTPLPYIKARINLNDFSIFIIEKGISFVIYKPEKLEKQKDGILHYVRFDIELLNADMSKIEFEEELPGYTNYYLPYSPEGILFVKSYRKVKIKDTYPGIDWVFKYENGEIHHEFEISPYANINNIKFRINYADVEIKDSKKLIISTPIGKIEDGNLFAYEGENFVDVKYKKECDLIGFDIKNWSKKQKLVIDPPLSLLWGTYYGANNTELGFSIAIDDSGNVFVTGETWSTNFPTYNPGGGAYYQGQNGGYGDVFILKFTNTGVRKWATYYGGYGGDYGFSIAIDDSGNVFVTGETWSTNFPTYNPGGGAYYQGQNAGYSDIFILKFTNTGIRKWATYYGGSNYESGHSITTDGSGNIFVTGYVFSTDFPLYNPGGGAYYQETFGGEFDAFILKFTNLGVRKWATYYGGNDWDEGVSIVADDSGNVFVTGYTDSYNFPTYNPGGGAYYQGQNAGPSDAFILKFTNTGVRKWATYYGGSDWDFGNSITTDNSGNIFVTGYTLSTNLPIYNPGGGAYYQETLGGNLDAFILKFTNLGVRKWATYYGGSTWDYGISITTDVSGNVFVIGDTKSNDFPIYNPGGGAYYQGQNAGDYDAFILKFTNTGVRKWATYYGGSSWEGGDLITTDISGNIFVVGNTGSTDLPTYNPGGGAYYQGEKAETTDIFILKFETSIDIEEKIDSKLKILTLPTFFNDRINLRLENFSSSPLIIYLYDVSGNLVYKKFLPMRNSTYINDENLKKIRKGIYFLKIKSGEKEFGKFKLIKR